MNSYVYDIEQFPNFFCVTFCPTFIKEELMLAYIEADINKDLITKNELVKQIGIKTFYVYKSINDANILYNFIRTIDVLFGYNNHHYDDLMLDYICNNRSLRPEYLLPKLYNLSKSIVEYEGSNIRRDFSTILSEYSNIKLSIDVMRLNYFDKLKISLKKVQVGLKWYRVEDLPKSFDSNVVDDEVYDIVDYNINDVLSTTKLVIHSLDELSIRQYTNKKFGFTGKFANQVLSYSRSKLANALISHFYSKFTNLEFRDFGYERTNRHTIKLSEIIDDKISFNTLQFKELLAKLKKTKLYVYDNRFTEEIFVGDNYQLSKYVLKTGGLHTEDRPGVFTIQDKPDWIIRDADVNDLAS